jgi:outer membrane protein insertion porin family
MLKYFIPIYLCLSLNLSAEVVQKLQVIGNDRISPETIKVYGDITINKNYSNFEINTILKNLYKTDFFEDVQISLDNGLLKIIVKEYPTINSVDLRGEKSNQIKKALLKQIDLKPKESFVKNKLAKDIDLLKKTYASIGFNFATVEAKIEKFDNNRINLIYFLDKGKKTNIAKISFSGDKKVKEKRLRDIIVSEEKKFWKFLSKNTFLNFSNIELDKRLLLSYYKSLGYYDVQVLSSNAEVSKNNLTILTYTINAGNRYRVNKISTNLSEVLDKKIFLGMEKEFRKVVGNYYSPFVVKKLLDTLDIIIADNDLQFIEHSVNEIIENNSIEIKINVYEGEKKLVERINILGNKVTNESVIRSELLLDEGDPFNSLKIEQSISRIKARNIFGAVTKKISAGANKDQKIIDISVVEKPTGEISAGAGIGTTGGSFVFGIQENNWLGRGIKLGTNIDISKETFKGGISVTNPNYQSSGNSLNYFASNTSNDKPDSGFENKVFSTGLGTTFEQYKDLYLSPGLSFSHDSLKVDPTASDSLKKQKGKFSDLSFNYGISLDKRDRAYSPTAGYSLGFNQAMPIYADTPYIQNSVNYKKYHSFSANTVGTFKIYASTINGMNGKDVRISKRNPLPSNKLRGFKAGKIGPKDGVDFVGGNYAMASNFEMTLPNLLPEYTKTDVGLFLDFGNLWEVDYDSSIGDSNKIRSTTGINASWLSPLGPMTFVFSQNLSKASSDVTESFNFKLGTNF